jgi:hypothetical protein
MQPLPPKRGRGRPSPTTRSRDREPADRETGGVCFRGGSGRRGGLLQSQLRFGFDSRPPTNFRPDANPGQRGNTMQITGPYSENKFFKHGSTCAHCGAEILPRRLRNKIVGRARAYCSNRCRQAAFRNAELAGRYQPSAAPFSTHPEPISLRNDENSSTNSIAQKVDSTGRASLGIPRVVLETEQRWRNSGQPIVSSNGVTSYIVGRLRRPR